MRAAVKQMHHLPLLMSAHDSILIESYVTLRTASGPAAHRQTRGNRRLCSGCPVQPLVRDAKRRFCTSELMALLAALENTFDHRVDTRNEFINLFFSWFCRFLVATDISDVDK
jgi:hypothetical protein